MTRPKARALIIVDVQNDFVEGGSLAVAGGKSVARRVSEYVAAHRDDYDLIIATRDDHDPDSNNGGHFADEGETPDYSTTWPAHCVRGTYGWEYAEDLDLSNVDFHVVKGQGVPAYSAFEGTVVGEGTLLGLLHEHHVDRLDVVGIATDFCVKATAIDAARAGFNTTVLASMTAAVSEETKKTAVDEMRDANVCYQE